MKQLLIVSGKGGTGKTTVAGAFIRLLQATAYADCDVDAPNLHLLLAPHTNPENADFYGLDKAEIDAALCIRCGVCARYCRFDAIEEARPFHVDPFACEGCGVCEAVCPARAVRMVPAVAGELLLYRNDAVFSTARLRMGSGNSGLLVSEVKKRLEQASPMAEIAVIDGSPGIGCPVIASLSGSNMVLVVTEPSVSGQSDLERILQTAQVFSMQCAVCVNRYDISMEQTEKIEAYCRKRGIPLAGRIPYDAMAVQAVNQGKTIVDLDCPSGRAVRDVFRRTMDILCEKGQP